MTKKISSKELNFLKTDADDAEIKPPETYFGDLLNKKPPAVKAFEERLAKNDIQGEDFVCAVVKISSDVSDLLQEKAKDAFEATFTSILDHGRGIWESLDDTSFVLAFWDYLDEADASKLLVSLKDRIHGALKADILMGVAWHPFHHFNKQQTFENALKAIDHAAFFGPDTVIHFDATSLNISGDRLYQFSQYEDACKTYKDGLKIKPKDINLLNSLGVCYAVMGELEKAKKQFDTAMKINPEEVMVVYNLGLLHKLDDNKEKAIVYLRKAHGLNDQVFEIELLLAHLLQQTDKIDAALKHLEAAAAIKSDSNAVFRLKGEIFLSRNQPEDAAREFNTAIKLSPSDALSLSGYAKSLALQGKNLKIAMTFARNSLDLEPENKVFKERLKFIEEKMAAAQTSETQSIKTA